MSLTFARSDEGQAVLHDIEAFGLPGVESARDLTVPQIEFLAAARAERTQREADRYQQ